MKTSKCLLALSTLLSLPPLAGFAQVTKGELEGVWYSSSGGSAYYEAPALMFVSDARALPPSLCEYTTWEIRPRTFTMLQYDACLYPEDVFRFKSKKTLRLSRQGSTQRLQIYRNGRLTDSFEFVGLSKAGTGEAKRMVLKRVLPYALPY